MTKTQSTSSCREIIPTRETRTTSVVGSIPIRERGVACMPDESHEQRAIELLQQLGLTEYEAQCFVALSRLGEATAREVSEASTVPRTRVYEIAERLSQKGLVETQQSSPKQFRTISIDDAVDVLRERFVDTTEALRDTLAAVEPLPSQTGADTELWTLSDETAIERRMTSLIEEAEEEVMCYIESADRCSDQFLTALQDAYDRNVTVIVGTTDEQLFGELSSVLPEQTVVHTNHKWLNNTAFDDDQAPAIIGILLVDRHSILLNTSPKCPPEQQHAVYGQGLNNGLVVVMRRLIASGLADTTDIE